MYEVKEHARALTSIAKNLKKHVDENTIEGVLVVRVFKNNEIEVESEFGRMTFYEWMGILEIVKETIKNGAL